MQALKYLSVCSGIEAATVAWHSLGWQPVAFSEIEPFPSTVLANHYPNTPNWGDMTKFQEWPDESVDILVGGTPCQSFSVAGLRKGLEDPRGNLMLTYLAIAQRYRPQWIVWENVPGVLSSNGGRDFGTFLGALGELGYGWSYRVLDAQWFGVAQRRRRVFVVGCLGDQRRAAQVLFERESVRRDSPPSREKGQGVARGAAAGAGERSHWDGDYPHPTLNQSAKGSGGVGSSNQELFSQRGAYLAPHPAAAFAPDVANCLETTSHDYSRADGFNMVAQPVAFRDPCPTLTARMQGSFGWAPTNEDAHLVGVTQPVAFHPTQDPITSEDGSTHCIGTGSRQGTATVAVAYGTDLYTGAINGDVAHTIRVGNGNAMGGVPSVMQPVAFAKTHKPMSSTDPEGWSPAEVAPTITHWPRDRSDGGTDVAVAYGTDCYNGAITGDVAATLGTPGSSVNASGPTVMQPVAFAQNQLGEVRVGEVLNTLNTNSNASGRNTPMVAQPIAPALTASNDPSRSPQSSEVTQQVAAVVEATMQVRRLTPVECERLQGFPDNYTNIPWRKKPEAPDGSRYKALGNSMAVPVMRWIGERIQRVSSAQPTAEAP